MPRKKPSLVRYTLDTLRQEIAAWKRLLRAEWQWLLMLVAGFALLLVYTRPLPPADVYLAVGERGSIFEALGQKIAPYFAAEGIELHLVNTSGSASSLAELADRDDRVNAALMVGGVAAKGAYPHLLSLGSIEYVPLWLFYRGPEFTGKGLFAHISDKRIAVGVDGSAERIVLAQLLKLSGQRLDDRDNYLKIPAPQAVESLLAGDIDALTLMDGIDSPNVRKLLASRDIHVANFAYAPAYVKKLPFLNTVVIPMGALDMADNRPGQDIQMLASTATLLVDSDMHPATQQLFLLAADAISNEVDQFFARPEFFPAYVDHAVALSPVAKRFYEDGPPTLRDSLPLWLINLVDRLWFLLLGAVAVILPIVKMFPGYRHMRAEILVSDAYDALYAIERELAGVQSAAHLQQISAELDQFEADNHDDWSMSIETRTLFDIRDRIDKIRTKARAKRQEYDERALSGSHLACGDETGDDSPR